MGFRENLKDELIYQDLKVKELAEMTGISKHTLDHYLATNGSQPQAELAVKIAKALKVSVEDLVCGKENGEKIEKDTSSVVSELEKLGETDYLFVKRLIHILYCAKK